MNPLKIMILILLFPISSFAQWKLIVKSNPFDGTYTKLYLIGEGKSPFESPVLNFIKSANNEYDIYISELGYVGCDNPKIIFKFDDKPQIHFIKIPYTNREKDAVFITNMGWDNEGLFDILPIDEILRLFKKSNNFYVRYTDDCRFFDLSFDLTKNRVALTNFD